MGCPGNGIAVAVIISLLHQGENDVCKCTCWLQDARDFGAFNRVYASYFPNGRPARSTTRADLMIDARVEIDVVAYSKR